MIAWYFVQNGVQAGPIQQEQLAAMLASGQLPGDTMVWCDGMSEWAAASTRIEFFDAAMDQPAVSPIPSVGGGAAAAAAGRMVFAGYAGFWKRFAALFIDTILLFGLGFAVEIALNAVFLASGSENVVAFDLVRFAVSTIIGWLYGAGMESSKYQATLGKMALGIIVTDTDGYRISFLRATGRHFAKILSGLIFLIGYFMAAFTERKQGLHDMIAGCLVVNKP